MVDPRLPADAVISISETEQRSSPPTLSMITFTLIVDVVLGDEITGAGYGRGKDGDIGTGAEDGGGGGGEDVGERLYFFTSFQEML